jgi:Protein of unknown function (DUF3562)
MKPPFEPATEAVRHERAIASLCDRTGAPPTEVRSLFAHEFSRLELDAKVRSYLSVLTASNVRAMLRRKGAQRPQRRQSTTGRRQLDRAGSPMNKSPREQ